MSTSAPINFDDLFKNIPPPAAKDEQTRSASAPISYDGGRILDDEFISMMDSVGFPRTKQVTIVLAVSGGADSMALALLTKRWAVRSGSKIICCIINHGFRVCLFFGSMRRVFEII